MERRFDAGEVTLNYAVFGDAGPPLVLLHRLTSRWQSWRPYLRALAPAWTVYALDLRGHGLSGRVPNRYRAADYARDLTAFLRAVTGRPAVLFGHSGGALAAMLAAGDAPDRARGLLLSEPPLFLLHDPVQSEPATYEWFSMVESVQTAGLPVQGIAGLLRARFPRVKPAAVRGAAEAVAQVDPGVARAALTGELVAGIDLAAALGRIRCPVTFLQGEQALGGSLWDEDARAIAAALPAARIHKLPGAGHNTVAQVEVVLGHLQELV